jgi:hypothetical protein
MLLTIKDNYTDNVDERVDLEVEVLTDHPVIARALRSIYDGTTWERTQTVQGIVLKTHEYILSLANNIDNIKAISLLVKGDPTVLVRGTKIDTKSLLFKCEWRSKYIPNGTLEYYWHIRCELYGVWNGLTTYQEEQLVARYQQDIMAILEDKDSYPLYVYYTANKWLEMLESATTQKLIALESILELTEGVRDGDFDADDKGEQI